MEQQIFYTPIIKPYSMKDLCRIYKVKYKIMRQWVKDHLGENGKKKTHLFTIAQIKALFQAIGEVIVPESAIGTRLLMHESVPVNI